MTSLVKRAIKFFLHKTFGHFLKEKLDLSQLDIDFKAGVVHLTHLELNSETINSLLGDLPLELRCGWIAHAWVTVPLKNITTTLVDHCKLELEGLRLTLAPRKVKRQRPLGESRAWGTQSDYGTRSAFNTAASITESLDHDTLPEEADESSPLTGERELNQIIDQLLLILENVRLKNLSIELEYECPTLGEEAVLCVEIPSFEYSDITRLAKATDTPSYPKESQASPTQRSSPLSEWNPSALIKCIKFPSLSVSLDRKSALPPSGAIDGRGDHRFKKGNVMLTVSQNPHVADVPPVNCPWANSIGLGGNPDASVIFIKLKRNTSDISMPDLDVDCTLQQVTGAISAEQLSMVLDLSNALNAMAGSPVDSSTAPASSLRESSPYRTTASETRQANNLTTISLPEDDLYSNQPTTSVPLEPSDKSIHTSRSRNHEFDSSSPDSSISDEDSFFDCKAEDEWFTGTGSKENDADETHAHPSCSVSPSTLLRLQAVLRVCDGSVNLLYGATSPSLCENLSMMVDRDIAAAYRAKGKEKINDNDRSDDDDSAASAPAPAQPGSAGERFTIEFSGLNVQTWASLLQTRIEIAAKTLELAEFLDECESDPHDNAGWMHSERRVRVLSFATPDPAEVPPTVTEFGVQGTSPKQMGPKDSSASPLQSDREGLPTQPASNPHFKCAIMLTNKNSQVDLPADVFDLDLEAVLSSVNIFFDLSMINRLSRFTSDMNPDHFTSDAASSICATHGNDALVENLSGSISFNLPIQDCIEPKSTRVRVGVQTGLCVVFYSPDIDGGRVILRVSDQLGPRVTTHIHSDQAEAVWLVEFDQLSASIDTQAGLPLLYSQQHQYETERTIFEAQMRNTQNEVVVPIEVAVRTDRWKPGFTYVHDITLSETLPEIAVQQDHVQLGSFCNFFSIFEGRGHQQAIAEATDYSKAVVTLRFPSSHVDIKKSEYDFVVKLLAGGKTDESSQHGSAKDSTPETMRRSSLDFPYGELVQKRRNALALNVFFTQGNWVFHENDNRCPTTSVGYEDGELNGSPPHYYELEFSKLHIFHLLKHAGTDRNYTVLTGEDFTIHDTVSYENTTPVAERIQRTRKEDTTLPMFRGLIESHPQNTECRFIFEEVVFHHQKGLNWLLSLTEFFKLAKNKEAINQQKISPLAHKRRDRQSELEAEQNDRIADSKSSTFRISLAFNAVEVEYTSCLLPARAVATIGTLEVASDDLVSSSNEDSFHGRLHTLAIYVINTSHNQQPHSTSSSLTGSKSSSFSTSNSLSSGAIHYWQQRGYVQVATLDHLDWAIVSRNEAYHLKAYLPLLQVTIVSSPVPTFTLMACSDALQTMLDLLGEWTSPGSTKPTRAQDADTFTAKQVRWDEVSTDAFIPKKLPKAQNTSRQRRRSRSSESESEGGISDLVKHRSKDINTESKSLASQLKLAEDYEYDPSKSPKGRFVVRDDYSSSGSSSESSDHTPLNRKQRNERAKAKEFRLYNSKQLAQQPDRMNSRKVRQSGRRQPKRIESDADSSSDIDVDWSSSSLLGEENEDDISSMRGVKPRHESDSEPSDEDPGSSVEDGVVDGEEIGLERGRKYKLMVEQMPPDTGSSASKRNLSPDTNREPQARWLSNQQPALEELLIEEFERVPRTDYGFTLPEGYPLPVLRLFGRFNVVIKLFGGNDWSTSSDSPSVNSTLKNRQEPARDGHLKSRSEETSIECVANNVEIQFDELKPGSQFVRRLVISVGEAEVHDHVPESDVNILMCYDKERPREPDASMFILHMECVRPDHTRPEQEEWRLRVRSLPLRLYLDQDALEFLVHYFSTMEGSPLIPEGEPLYFQSCEVRSVHLKVDYQPKQLDYNALYGANKTTFFAKAVPLRAAEIHLKPVRVKGRGWDELLGKRLVEAYLPYINRTQLSSVVAGIAPIRSLLNISSGVGDIIHTPLQEWQKDGRILSGLQRGVSSALQKWLKEGLNVGTNLTAGAQYMLETADYYLGGSGGSVTCASIYAHAPANAEEGVREAYSSISREVEAAVHRIVAVPLDQYQKHGTTGYISSLASGVPLAILRPMIGVTEGVTKTLIGVQKWVDPTFEEEIATKFKKTSSVRRSHQGYGVGEESEDGAPPRGIDSEEGDALASYDGGMFYNYGAALLPHLHSHRHHRDDTFSDEDSEDDSD